MLNKNSKTKRKLKNRETAASLDATELKTERDSFIKKIEASVLFALQKAFLFLYFCIKCLFCLRARKNQHVTCLISVYLMRKILLLFSRK